MSDQRLLVFSTCPDVQTAQRIAERLVGQRLAACVNILPAGRSIYEWQGSLQIDAEVVLLVKTTRAALPQLQAALSEEHPYELPELIAVPIVDGSKAYLKWLDAQIGPE